MLVMFFVTCDEFFSDEGETEYTDVEYSEDLTKVTVYLDGKGVPKSAAQRAITRDLAKMSYDFFEVTFIGTAATDVARASWELGQPAGISGVDRGATAAGIDYGFNGTGGGGATTSDDTDNTKSVAIMFVGKKDNKTLLGIGKIGEVDHSATVLDPATGFPTTGYSATINDGTTSVTFYIEAIKTGLLVKGETVAANTYGIKNTSFAFVAGTGTTASTVTGWDKSTRTTLGGIDYPLFNLPQKDDTTGKATAQPYQNATYTFEGAAESYKSIIKYNVAFTAPAAGPPPVPGKPGLSIEKRIPRYLDGGRYYQPKSNVDSDTTIELDAAYYGGKATAGTAFDPKIPLVFQTKGSGIFSFYLEIPVYMLDKTKASTNGDIKAEIWKIRTGIGSELWSLDSGKSTGGCVLMGVGVSSLDDWIDIEWEWVTP